MKSKTKKLFLVSIFSFLSSCIISEIYPVSEKENSNEFPVPEKTHVVTDPSFPNKTPLPVAESSAIATPNISQDGTSSPDIKPSSDNENTFRTISTSKIEEYIFQFTNNERQKQGLSALKNESKVADVARRHSLNMLEHGFFDHTDHQGMSSSDRMNKYYPEFFGGVAENIYSISGLNNTDEKSVARDIIAGWMNSPGHRANILNGKYNYLGVGVTYKNGKLYATQNFVEAYAVLKEVLPVEASYGQTLTLKFKFLGSFEKERLSLFVDFPDKSFQFFLSDGSYYTGTGEYTPVWDGSDFTITLKLNAGIGNYTLKMAKDGRYYESNAVINVIR